MTVEIAQAVNPTQYEIANWGGKLELSSLFLSIVLFKSMYYQKKHKNRSNYDRWRYFWSNVASGRVILLDLRKVEGKWAKFSQNCYSVQKIGLIYI